MKKIQALVQILSPGGARGDFTFYPLLKKMPDDVVNKSANQTANLQWCSGNRNTPKA
jgi:hypothetical protein